MVIPSFRDFRVRPEIGQRVPPMIGKFDVKIAPRKTASAMGDGHGLDPVHGFVEHGPELGGRVVALQLDAQAVKRGFPGAG